MAPIMRPLSCIGKNPLDTCTNRYAFKAIVASRIASVSGAARNAAERVTPYKLTVDRNARSVTREGPPCSRGFFRRVGHIMGVAVSQTSRETGEAVERVTANSRKGGP